MGLDITFLDSKKAMSSYIPLSVDEHWHMIQIAKSLRLTHFMKMEDYYNDTKYFPIEVSELREELAKLLQSIPNETALRDVANKLLIFVTDAIEQGEGIQAIAD